MQKIWTIAIVSILLTGCLKKDILKAELNGANFRESQFFLSGDFQSDFSLVVDQVATTRVANAAGDSLCKPAITMHLEEDYAARLEQEWPHEIHFVFRRGMFKGEEVFSLTDNEFTDPIIYGKHPAIDCEEGIINLEYSIQLIDPHHGRVAAYVDTAMSFPLNR